MMLLSRPLLHGCSRNIQQLGFSLNKVVARAVPMTALLLCWLGLQAPAPASARDADAYAAQVVRCQSRNLEWTHCRMDVENGVDLVRQLSEQACVRGSQWGTDSSGVWVTMGCRAEFLARRAAAQGEPRVQVRRVVRCESKGRPQSCPVRLNGAPVRLLRQNSYMPCRQDQSWGYRRNEIWTTRGCQGDFEIGDEQTGAFVDVPRRIACDSKDRRRRFCGATVSTGVRLLEQRSSRACEEGRSWGWDRFGIWVDEGCRGDFSVN